MSKIRFFTEEEIAARERAEEERFAAEMREMDERQRERSDSGETDEITLDDIFPPDPDPVSGKMEHEEGYGLIPDELESELDRQSRRTDREIAGESEESIKSIEETELMDEMLEKGTRTPLQEFLGDLKLPSPAAVATDEEADRVLKLALAKLALAGVAFHVCEHCSIHEVYRIFIEEVCASEGHFRPLVGTGWVQNFCTSDYCKQCMGDDTV
jgi:hypothetical protein